MNTGRDADAHLDLDMDVPGSSGFQSFNFVRSGVQIASEGVALTEIRLDPAVP